MKQVLYPYVKWGARISIVAMIFLPSLFYTAYTVGIVTESPYAAVGSYQLYCAVMHHPVTAMVLKLAIIAVSILISFIEVQNVHGRQATERIRACIRCLFSAPWLALALLLFGTHFIIDSSPVNGPLCALALIPTLWFIGLLFIPDPEQDHG